MSKPCRGIYKKLSVEDKIKCFELYKEGLTGHEIGKKMGCSHETVYTILRNKDKYENVRVVPSQSVIIEELKAILYEALDASLKPFNGNGGQKYTDDIVVTQDLTMQKCKSGDVVQVQHVTVNYNVSNTIIKALQVADRLRDTV